MLEVGQLAPALVDALAGELEEDAYRVAIALEPTDPTPAALKLALRIAKSPLQLIANLYDDAPAAEVALFQRQVERALPLTGRGVCLVKRS